MKKIIQYLKPYFGAMAIGLIIKFVGTVMDLALPYILSYIIDDVIPLRDVPQIFFWGGVMIACAVVAIFGNIIANRKAARVARDTTEALRHDLFVKIGRLSCSQTDRVTIPSLISRLSSDSYNVHQMIGMMQRLGVRAPILLIGGILVTFTLEPYLTMVLVTILPLLGAAVYIVSKKGIPLYAEVQRAVDKMVGKVQEYMVGVRVIKALSKSDYEREHFDSVSREVVRREQKAGIIMSATNPIMNFLLNTGLAAVIIVGAYRVNGGVSQPGKIIAFLSYFTIILNAMLSITRLFINFSKGAASADRIASVLDEGDELPVSERDHRDTEQYISFEKVNFSYHKANCESAADSDISQNLTNISFGVQRGGMIGVIGATGSGKTTLVNLLLRFYDPDSGVIRIGGDDIRTIPYSELYSHFGVAFQNDFLFADTIAENINFGRGLSEQQLHRAASAAQALDFIEQKPEGFNYTLTVKGANLSGGQKQRLLVARALAADPDILILDDSSSALDYKTDASLRRCIREYYPRVTSFIVAQRVSSIMAADVIVMLDDGNIIGMGTHEQLMRSCDAYREIAQSQMGEGDI